MVQQPGASGGRIVVAFGTRVGQQVGALGFRRVVTPGEVHYPVFPFKLILQVEPGLIERGVGAAGEGWHFNRGAVIRVEVVDRARITVACAAAHRAVHPVNPGQKRMLHRAGLQMELRLVIHGEVDHGLLQVHRVTVDQRRIGMDAPWVDHQVIAGAADIAQVLAEGHRVVKVMAELIADAALLALIAVKARLTAVELAGDLPVRVIGQRAGGGHLVVEAAVRVFTQLCKHRQAGAIARLPGEGWRNVVMLIASVVDLRFGIEEGSRHAAKQRVVVGQRAGDIKAGAKQVIVAGGHIHFPARLGLRGFAHHIDHPARVGLAVQYRRWAFHHLNARQQERVPRRAAPPGFTRQTQAIEIFVGFKTTHHDGVKTGIRPGVFRCHAGDIAQRLRNGFRRLRSDLRLGDHGDTLRCAAYRLAGFRSSSRVMRHQ